MRSKKTSSGETLNKYEEWKPIPGFESYKVSNCGRVSSIERSIYIQQSNGSGYIRHLPSVILRYWRNGIYRSVTLWKNREPHQRYIHHLVAEVFIGQRPDGLHINHIDGDKQNNYASNLEYCTVSENLKHAVRIGLRVPHCTFTDDEVLFMRSLKWMYGVSIASIAAQFQVYNSTIQKIVSFKRRRVVYNHSSNQFPERHLSPAVVKKLEAQIGRRVLRLDVNGNILKEYKTVVEAANDVGLHHDAIYYFLRRGHKEWTRRRDLQNIQEKISVRLHMVLGIPTPDELSAGSLQRIADSLEKMEQPYLQLLRDVVFYKKRVESYSRQNDTLRKRVAAYQGVIKRMKKEK